MLESIIIGLVLWLVIRFLCGKDKKVKTLIVLGTGGHTIEMVNLIKDLNKKLFTPIIFIFTDEFCRETVIEHYGPQVCPFFRSVLYETFSHITRARAVGQSWFTSIFTTFYSLIIAFGQIFYYRVSLRIFKV